MARILDLHLHSEASDDSRAPVEAYLKWLARKRDERPLEGLVLTEHRKFHKEGDYRDLEDKYGLLILKASEVETDYGHVLVYGVNDDILKRFDFTNVRLNAQEVISEAARMGGIAMPCHPGRPTIGLIEHYEKKPSLEGVIGVEALNGGSKKGENERVGELIEKYGYHAFGGSDSHLVSFIGLCATEFDRDIKTIEDLVAALRTGGVSTSRFSPAATTTARRFVRSSFMALEFDRSIIGQVFDETHFPPVTKEEIVGFAVALGETNPLYTDEAAAAKGPYGELIAPPTFVTKLRPNKFTPEHLPKFGKFGFDGGRDLEIHAPVRPGDTLTMLSTIHEIYEKTGRTGSMYFIVIRNEVKNQKGEKVAVIDHRIMQR